MHPLMAAVLLGVAGDDALNANAQAQPPHRQLREAKKRVRAGKGRPVVGADGLGEAKFLENAFEDAEGIHRSGAGESLAADQVSAGEVRDSQRIAVAAIAEHELALRSEEHTSELQS